MKKKIISLFIFLFILIGAAVVGRNFIVKKIFEIKLTEANNGKVDIESVEFSPLAKKIVLHKIDVTSKKDTLKNFVSIDRVEADYDIYFQDKKVLISNADISGIDFMTNRTKDGSMSHIIRDEDSKVVEIPNLEEEKNNVVKDLENLMAARVNVSQEILKDNLEANYQDIEKQIKNKGSYWKSRIKRLENTKDYKIVKDVYTQVTEEKNPIKLLRMEKSIRRAGKSFKNLSKEVLSEREEMLKDLKRVDIKGELNNSLGNSVNEILGKGQLIVLDLDSMVNFYLNEIYKESVEEFVERYRSLMKEVEIRRDEDMQATDRWEVFIEKIELKTNLYGIDLAGEINSISSRLSKNLEDTGFSLKANSDNTQGEVRGIISIKDLKGDIKVDIEKVDLNDIKNLEILDRYVNSGVVSIDKDIRLTRDNIYLDGDFVIGKMKLNSKEISKQLNISSPFLKDMILPLLNEVNVGKINYVYNSENGKLKVESNLSKEITKVLNSDKGEMRKKISKELRKQGEATILDYQEKLNKESKNALSELQGELNIQTEYLGKIQEVFEKYNLKKLFR